MALANFFDRAATAASQALSRFQADEFKDKLSAQKIGIAFDGAAASSAEGVAALDLLVRLLARLYPTLAIRALDADQNGTVRSLKRLAKAINPDIAISASLNSIGACVVVGETAPKVACATYFVGSDAWRAKLSSKAPVGSGGSTNPFGAGAAACFAAANVFRSVFREQIVGGEADTDIDLNLLTYASNNDAYLELEGIDIGDTHLVGLGAIGNGAMWALARAEGVCGNLSLIDHQEVELSNLQRYVLAVQKDVNTPKTDVAMRFFKDTSLKTLPVSLTWKDYVATKADWKFERVGVALDTASDRIVVQGALPKWIANAWTQTDDLGVSRHSFDDDKACLACLYLPAGKVKDEHEQIAEELRMPEAAIEIRTLLQTGGPVSADFVQRVAAAFNVPFDHLSEFVGAPIRSFHQGAICGGLMLKLTNSPQASTASVPMAFQSALAGILLAAEILKHSAGEFPSATTITRINLLRPLAKHLNDPRAKDVSGRCICSDPDFQAAFIEKYATSSSDGV